MELILIALEHASFAYTVHASYRIVISIFSMLTYSLPLFFPFCSFSLSFVFVLWSLASWLGRLEPIGPPPLLLPPTFSSERFLSEKNQEAYEKLNLKRNIWTERKVLLDELDPEIRCNFKRRGWLPLLDVDHPPSATLIGEFYSNLSVHSYEYNTLVKSWKRGDEYTITPSVVAAALGVLVVQHPIYSYDESPPLDDIMSYITGSSIQ